MPGVDITASGSILEASSFSKLSFWNEKKKRLWIGTQLLVLESVVCLFVLDCFGVTGKLQEYIQ